MYGYQMDVAMPIEMYDRVSAEIQKKTGGLAQGCLLHLVTRIDGGFRVTEVWESHEAADRFGDEVLRPTIESVLGAEATAGEPPPSEELDVHHLQLGESAKAGA